jgi:hypothetical protein
VERQKSDMFTLNAQQGSWVIKLCQFCGLIESAFRPSCGFWCMNDKMIKELINFAKCETEKYLVIMLKLFIHQDICYGQYDCTS